MSWFVPPNSTERYEIFGRGGGQRIADQFGIPLLGQVPIGLNVRKGGDEGVPIVLAEPESEFARAFEQIAGQVAARISTLNLSTAVSS
jgi:ATP-binding protein involved in chromosome partitioning